MSNIITEEPTKTGNITSARTVEEIKKDINALYLELHLARPKVAPEEAKAKRKAQLVKKYTTKNGLTIHGLRQAGNKVRVVHIRFAATEDHPFCPVSIPTPTYLREYVNFSECGGATHIEIMSKNGVKSLYTSICHIDDHFCYKLGVKEALDLIGPEETAHLMGK